MDAKKQESGSGDAISSLPDEILAEILCLLPTKRAASTTVLSKRWRNLFAMMIRFFASQHHLVFDDSDLLYPNKQKRHDHVQESFRTLVDSTLSLGNCNSIKKFTLKCEDDLDNIRARTSRWISNAVERGVSDLDLRITMPLILEEEQIEQCLLPSVFFTSNTLVKLTLGTGICIGASPEPEEVFLPSLKSLFLYTVWFAHQDFTDLVTFGCPVLEELYIHHKYINQQWWSGPYDFCHPTIKKITIHLDYGFPQIRRLAFNTPNLVYLDYSDHVEWCDYYCANFLDSLIEARLDLVLPPSFSDEDENYSKFVSWICNVQILCNSIVR